MVGDHVRCDSIEPREFFTVGDHVVLAPRNREHIGNDIVHIVALNTAGDKRGYRRDKLCVPPTEIVWGHEPSHLLPCLCHFGDQSFTLNLG
jgi:hypothetical protein